MKWTNIPKDIKGYEGFVYLIENLKTNKKYVGKKTFWFRRKKKGAKRKTTRESDWKDYYGSCDELTEDVKKLGKKSFSRTIMYLCVYKKQMTYLEQKEQWSREVLTSDDYYNTNIGGKFFVYESHIFEGKPKVVQKNKKWREIKSESMKGDKNVAKRKDVRKKISLKKRGKNHHQYGKPISEEHKQKLTTSRNIKISDGKKIYKTQDVFLKENHIGYAKYREWIKDGKIKIIWGDENEWRQL